MVGWNPAPKATDNTITQAQAKQFKTGLTVDLQAFMVTKLRPPAHGQGRHSPIKTK
jgi:hypothetical protein